MKKAIAAMVPVAALMSVGTAAAQSSVTAFGVVDTSLSGYWNQADGAFGNTITTSQTALTNSAYSSSRIGFRGTEDLGGGLAANFWLEAGINTDDGSGVGSNGGLQFNRRSTVSLESKTFGELRLGRDYTPTYWNDNLFDPFSVNGVGTSLISTASGQTSPGSVRTGWTNGQYSRASNSIGYFLPKLNGFYGQFMYAFNEAASYDPASLTPPGAAAIVTNPALAVADNSRAGRYIGGRAGYASGNLDVVLAYGESTVGSNYYLGTTTTINIWSLAGSYDFGVLKLFGEYSNNKMDTVLATNAFNPFGVTKPGFNGVLIGATIPVFGYDLIRVSYSGVRYNNTNTNLVGTTTNFFGFNNQPKADKFAIGYVYNFSKRTAVYATYAYVSNKDGAGLSVGGPNFYVRPVAGIAAVPDKSYGYDLGIRFSF
ncbi:porin [Variovorax sp. GT1P44]|uniref:porin n=1 Tax=Variovorax sp. GT1P44 TaxID=3443742 RepID=UPI003F48F616